MIVTLRNPMHISVDIHGFLDNLKVPHELIRYRTKYYKFVLLAVFESIGILTVTKHDAKKADEQYLDADFQFGGVDQVREHLSTLCGVCHPPLMTMGCICSGKFSLLRSSTFHALAMQSVPTS